MAPRGALIGPPGAGKSTIGRRVAQALDLSLLDTDAEIERTTGRTIPEIFEQDGETAFREIEEKVVAETLAQHAGSSRSAAAPSCPTGRGNDSPGIPSCISNSVRRGTTAHGNNSRPLLNGGDPAQKYRDLMRRRRPLYRQSATIRVRTDGRSPGRVVQQVLTKLGAVQDAAPAETTPENRSITP